MTGILPHLPGCNPTFGAEGYKPPTCPNRKDPQVLTPAVGYLGSAPPAGSCALSGGASVLAKTTNGYGFAGCFTYEGARPFFTTSHGAGMTIDQCAVAAAKAGHKTFGVEYGGECRSTTSAVPIPKTDSGKCSMPCTVRRSICDPADRAGQQEAALRRRGCRQRLRQGPDAESLRQLPKAVRGELQRQGAQSRQLAQECVCLR